MDKRDKWDESVRSKLEHFEAEPKAGDWEAIERRLAAGKPVIRMTPRRWMYSAAAILLLFLLLDGGYRLWFGAKKDIPVETISKTPIFLPEASPEKNDTSSEMPADERVTSFTARPRITGNKVREKDVIAKVASSELSKDIKETSEVVPTENYPSDEEMRETVSENKTDEKNVQQSELDDLHIDIANEQPLIAEVSSRQEAPFVSRSRWRFGLGGGSYSVGSGGVNAGGVDLLSNNLMSSGFGAYAKRSSSEKDMPDEKLDVTHKRPISFGLGVSYMLNDRWALQSGLTYTYMKSTWRTESLYQGKAKQRLHFIGIPLGINYKIAEWQRFHFYAGAGAMVEWNVAGNITTDYYYGNEKVDTRRTSVRMKAWQWSVNARTGVSYPLFRYLSAYAEGNASYYFNNGSSVETIRSDKPFYVSLQAGFRLGF